MLENCFGNEVKHYGEGIQPNKEAGNDGDISPSKKVSMLNVIIDSYLYNNIASIEKCCWNILPSNKSR